LSIHPSYPPLPSSSGPLTYSALLCNFTLPPLPSADTQSRIPSCNHHTRHQHLLYRPGNLGQSQPTLLSSCSSPPIRVPPPYSAPEPSPRDMPSAYSLGTLSVNARVLRSTCAWDTPWSWETGFASPTVSRFPMTALDADLSTAFTLQVGSQHKLLELELRHIKWPSNARRLPIFLRIATIACHLSVSKK
jgi:hypothetical protein